MRIQPLLLIPLAALSAASFLPSGVHAARIPVCTQMPSQRPCYAWDPNDCIEVNGIRYCRTVTLYYWEI